MSNWAAFGSNSHKKSLRVRGQRQQKRQLPSSTQLHRNDNNSCVYSTQARAIGTTKTGIAIIDATAQSLHGGPTGIVIINATAQSLHGGPTGIAIIDATAQSLHGGPSTPAKPSRMLLAIAGDGIELIPSGQPQLLSRRITQLLPKPSSQVKKIV